MKDKNGIVLTIGQMVEINGQVWQVGASFENGQHIIETCCGKILINKISGDSRWVDPRRLTVTA